MLTKKQINQFGEAFANLFKSATAAGHLIVQFELEEPDAIKILAKHFKTSVRLLKKLKRLANEGQDGLREDLFWATSEGEAALAAYPRSVQDDMMRGPVEVAVLVDGQITRERKAAHEMTADEVRRSACQPIERQVQALQEEQKKQSVRKTLAFDCDSVGIIPLVKNVHITWAQIDAARASLPKPNPHTLESQLKYNQMMPAPNMPAPQFISGKQA